MVGWFFSTKKLFFSLTKVLLNISSPKSVETTHTRSFRSLLTWIEIALYLDLLVAAAYIELRDQSCRHTDIQTQHLSTRLLDHPPIFLFPLPPQKTASVGCGLNQAHARHLPLDRTQTIAWYVATATRLYCSVTLHPFMYAPALTARRYIFSHPAQEGKGREEIFAKHCNCSTALLLCGHVLWQHTSTRYCRRRTLPV